MITDQHLAGGDGIWAHQLKKGNRETWGDFTKIYGGSPVLIEGIVAGVFFTLAAFGIDRWRQHKDPVMLWTALLSIVAGALSLLPRTVPLLLITTPVMVILVVIGVILLRRTPKRHARCETDLA
jgi:hypothetical protein